MATAKPEMRSPEELAKKELEELKKKLGEILKRMDEDMEKLRKLLAQVTPK